MKKLSKLAMLTAVTGTLAMTGCTKTLSEGITEQGTIDPTNLVFPDLNDAWQLDGQFPNIENMTKIKPGIAKDELYQLIGRPHFSEAQHAHEWDYIMKFYKDDGNVQVCQYKVIFDDEYKGQEFYWLPADCAKYLEPKAPVVVQAPAPVAPVVLREEKITLDADALFKFDKSDLGNMLPAGRAKLDELADKIHQYGLEGDVRMHLTGHTDRKGSESYNMGLSQRRANTVKAYLVQRGINPASMTTQGLGESQPVQQCSTSLPRQQEIDCLQPNRRVEADVIIYQRTQNAQ